MDAFHLVIDTSMLRRLPFQHADFKRLLIRSQMGSLKIYIPQIALEEERTAQLAKHAKTVEEMNTAFAKLQRGMLGMLVEGLPEPHLQLWNADEVDRNSQAAFDQFVTTNKIEVIVISMEHAAKAWARYFNVDPPFNPNEEREDRRKDIPDSWILEAGIEIKPRKGQHCALVGDNKLAAAFETEGFKVYRDVATLLDDIEQATAVVPIRRPVAEEAPIPLDQLRSPAFKDMDVIVLGLIEALNMPTKDELFSVLENAGFDRAIAEHEARTLVLSGRLNDATTHFVPTSRALAQQAAATDSVTKVLLKVAQ
ncbi:PIN domain-containing protein [Burkholderia ubonensis]|uniref:PIN domain-containing protein n=1 Tax=Burkholderia ubonensis TaxID=101571 RepID=UPI000A98079F|nr:PIN domain-containing protein [Burkholderia ubonensis]